MEALQEAVAEKFSMRKLLNCPPIVLPPGKELEALQPPPDETVLPPENEPEALHPAPDEARESMLCLNGGVWPAVE
eukprot:1143517-Pelagomonas_calceolata.AAC.20